MSATSHIRYYRIARNTATLIAVPLTAIRAAQVFDLIHTPDSVEAGMFVVSVLAVVSALLLGWLVDSRQLAARAAAAEWEARRLKREQEILDGDEDRALWDSIEPAASDHDTCAFGVNVVAINQWRGYPNAG